MKEKLVISVALPTEYSGTRLSHLLEEPVVRLHMRWHHQALTALVTKVAWMLSILHLAPRVIGYKYQKWSHFSEAVWRLISS